MESTDIINEREGIRHMECPTYLNQINPEVFYHEGDSHLLSQNDIEFLKYQASKTPRRRARICLHSSPQDAIHEMLIVHHRTAYVRPHAHKGYDESLHVLEGRAEALFFEPSGTVRDIVTMANRDQNEPAPFFYRIKKGEIHSLRIKSEWFVFQEVAAGPFDPANTLFPDWVPDGAEEVDALKWISQLKTDF